MGLFEWYIEQPILIRLGLALAFLAAGAAELVFLHRFRPWTWALGVVLLIFCIPSRKSATGGRRYNF